MGAFVSYMLQVTLVMTLLYLVYRWVMASTTFHMLNRVALLSVYLLSWILPAVAAADFGSRGSDGTVEIGLPVVVSYIGAETAAAETGFNWMRALLWIYIAGASATLLHTIAGGIRMAGILCSGVHRRMRGYTEVVTDRAPGPFSWGRYVVLRPCDCDADMRMVVEHERTHLRLSHWLDLVPAQLTAVLQWYSPAAWLMIHELKECHEYEVDRIVAGDNPAAYQMMLIKKTVGSSFPTFADSLNHSQIKKRITMMMTKRTSPSRRAAALALPAVAALAMLALSQPAVADVIGRVSSATLSDVLRDKVSDSSSTVQLAGEIVAVQSVAEDAESAATAEAVAESVPQQDVQSETAEGETVQPQSGAAEEKGVADEKPAYFIDGKLFNGSITDISPDDIFSMTIKKDDPAYPQGKIMIETRAAAKAAGKNVEKDPTVAPQKLAEFKGGMTELRRFIEENIKYPAGVEATDKPIMVIVQFTVKTDGSIADAKVLRSKGEAYDKEAVRVVNLMSGKWIPAENDGKPIDSKFTVPLTFTQK